MRAKATASTAATGVKKTTTTTADATKDTARVARKSAQRTTATAPSLGKANDLDSETELGHPSAERPVRSEEGSLHDTPHHQEGHVDDQLTRSALCSRGRPDRLIQRP